MPRPNAFAPTGQRTRVDRQPVLQIVEAAEELPIQILDPALAHLFVGEVVDVFEIAQPDHQSRRFAGPACALVIERSKRSLETRLINQPGEPHQRMLQVELVAEPGPKEIVGTLAFRPSWTHGKSPENRRGESDFRHFAILVDPKESLISQALPHFSGPTG